jgi:voltage-gated potassium channel
MTPKHLTRNNIILLICLLMVILFFPLLSSQRVFARHVIFTAIILSGTFSLGFKKKRQIILICLGAITIIFAWLDLFFPIHLLRLLSFFSFFCFNVFITVFMVRHVARSKHVNLTIIINSINGFLLVGVLGAVLLAITEVFQKFGFITETGAISLTGAISFAGNTATGFHDYLYFSFVTLTTLGYGDVTPVSALAKSITIIIAVSGQLYLTILIALLVGKFLSRTEKN